MDDQFRSIGLFALAAVLTGGVYVATKAGLPYVPPVLFASFRFGVAAVLLMGYVRLTTQDWYPSTRADWMAILAAGGLVVATANALLFVGQQFTTSATAAVLVSVNPVLTAGFAVVLLPNTDFSLRRLVGLLVGLAGVGIVARPASASAPLLSALGVGLIVAAATALALGSVLLRRVTTQLSTLAITGWATAVGGLTLFVLSLALGESIAAIEWTRTAVVAVAYNGLLATPVVYVAYFELVETIGPVRVNLLTYASPVVTAVAGWALLGETVPPATMAGFVVIATGFVLVNYRAFRRAIRLGSSTTGRTGE